MTTPANIPPTTRPLLPETRDVLGKLQPGQRVRITQRVRVGSTATWTTTVTGTFRGLDALATGLSTDRVPEDDIVVPLLHFTKDNGELSSVTLDENSKVEILSGAS